MSISNCPLGIPAARAKLSRVSVYLFLVVFQLIPSQSIAGQTFCGHSHDDDADGQPFRLERTRRSAAQLPARPRSGLEAQPQGGRAENEFTTSEATTTVIDDSRGPFNSFKGARVGSQVECSKSADVSCNDELATSNRLVKTIETAVFIDQALDNKFNGLSNGLVELNKLVLTIMNQVQQLFRYSSLQVPITIKLVLVEHLKDSERQGGPVPNPERGDIDAYLSNFCNWQQDRLDRERRLWWDHAILLSG